MHSTLAANAFSRRAAIGALGAGFGQLALSDLLAADGGLRPAHHTPRAKAVIFIFLSGGPSHLELFDPKPLLHRYAGQRPAEANLRTERPTRGLLPSSFQFAPGGQCGTQVSDLLPKIRDRVDDLCLIRSMYGINPNHGAASNFLFSGRIDQIHPSLGAWVSYGLGSENRDLPSFVSLRRGGVPSLYVRNGYLPGAHQGTPIDIGRTDPQRMVQHLNNPRLGRVRQREQVDFIQALNEAHADGAADAAVEARIASMETAFRMQFAAGEALDVGSEPQATREAYGEGWFSNGCLLARRLVERGVRYIHLEHQRWDHHESLDKHIPKLASEVDRPIAALLDDLKQRGLLDETLVVCGGEFGRTPVSENGNGRDHNHYGYSTFLAGGGVRGGTVHGATHDFGFRAVEDRVGVHDLHATMLHQLGFDHTKLTHRYSGRDFRLTDVHGRVIHELLDNPTGQVGGWQGSGIRRWHEPPGKPLMAR